MIRKLLIVIGIIFVLCVFIILLTNKTFFKTTYIGIHDQEIFIPSY